MTVTYASIIILMWLAYLVWTLTVLTEPANRGMTLVWALIGWAGSSIALISIFWVFGYP